MHFDDAVLIDRLISVLEQSRHNDIYTSFTPDVDTPFFIGLGLKIT
jgi:hypothetical protein